LIPNFIFIIFNSFLVEGERKSPDFNIYREKIVVGDNFSYQNNRSLCQIIPYDEGVTIRFFLILKTLRKTDLDLRIFLGFRLILDF
jgi:hypothetical protein